MSQPSFRKNKINTAIRAILAFPFLIVALEAVGHSQEVGALSISYFVSPEYPPLARQMMQSGDVVLGLIVEPSGTPKVIEVKAPHPLLGDYAKESVSKWRFTPLLAPHARSANVIIHYSFSGTPRDCNPKTTVTADLIGFNIIVTVDPRLPFQGESVSTDKKGPEKGR